jgi:hypothetical protein
MKFPKLRASFTTFNTNQEIPKTSEWLQIEGERSSGSSRGLVVAT